MSEARPSRRTPQSIFAIAAAVAAIAILFFLASRIMAGNAFAFDHRILLALRHSDGTPIGSPRFASAVRDVTALGSTTVLTMVVLFAVVLLATMRRWRSAALVAVATGLGTTGNVLLKTIVARTRPDLVPHLVDESSKSFPSGHAANSAIVYLTLATLVWPLVRGHATRGAIMTAAATLVVAIGASRVYLGVHWPSDVLAGWLFGSLWAIGWWRVEMRVLARR
jgi:undecaprenyl-diphosphatase